MRYGRVDQLEAILADWLATHEGIAVRDQEAGIRGVRPVRVHPESVKRAWSSTWSCCWTSTPSATASPVPSIDTSP